MKRFILVAVLFSMSIQSSFSTVYETVKAGSWSSTSTWSGGNRPGNNVNSSHTVNIKHAVALSANVTVSCNVVFYSGGSISGNYNFSVNTSGSLTSSNGTVSISCKNVSFYGNAQFDAVNYQISCSQNFSVNSLMTINTGCSLSVSAANILLYSNVTVNGNVRLEATTKIQVTNNLSCNGELVMNSPLYNFYNTISVDNSGSMTLENISSSATISNSVSIIDGSFVNYSYFIIYNNLSISSSGSFTTFGTLKVNNIYTNNGTFTVESGEEKTGNLIYYSKNGSNNNIVVKRFMKSDGWHYISSPVHNSSSNVFHSAALYSYNESQGNWTAVYANQTLTNMKGYDAYYKSQHKTVVFNGEMNDGTISINVSNTLGSSSQGYNLVGNPYPSAIDWNASAWTKTNINNAVYVWDDNTQSITTYVNGVGTNGGSNIIPATMAFFVKCNNNSGGVLSATNSVRIPNYVNFRSLTSDNVFKVRINGNGYSDEAAISFNDNASTSFDAQFDAEKMYSYNPEVPQLFTVAEDCGEYAVNSLPNSSITQSIPLNVKLPVSSSYELEFDMGSFDVTYDVFVEDKMTDQVFDTKTGNYKFTSDNVGNADRFLLHFVPVQVISGNTNTSRIEDDQITSVSDNSVWTAGSELYVASRTEGSKNISVYDLNGKSMMNTVVNATQSKISLNLNPGCYLVKISENEKTEVVKVIIK